MSIILLLLLHHTQVVMHHCASLDCCWKGSGGAFGWVFACLIGSSHWHRSDCYLDLRASGLCPFCPTSFTHGGGNCGASHYTRDDERTGMRAPLAGLRLRRFTHCHTRQHLWVNVGATIVLISIIFRTCSITVHQRVMHSLPLQVTDDIAQWIIMYRLLSEWLLATIISHRKYLFTITVLHFLDNAIASGRML